MSTSTLYGWQNLGVCGGRPREISPDDEALIVTTANTRPETFGLPFTRWSIRKLADHPAHHAGPGANTWPRSDRSGRPCPDGAPIYVILDNLSARKGAKIRAGGRPAQRRAVLHPTYASWANPIEAQFGPLRTFAVAGSDHPNHPALARALHAYLRWRNANARHREVLAAQRRDRAKIRSERRRRWGQPATRAA